MGYFIIFAGTILRLLPHMPNFTPIGAIALFGGVYLDKRRALIIPLLALFISDLFLGFYSAWIMVAVYGSFALIGLMGLWLRNHKSLRNIVGGSLFGSLIFFIITNFAVWAVPHSFYSHSWSGLVLCYTNAIPFFRNTIMGDLFYTALMFGSMELVIKIVQKYRKKGLLKNSNLFIE